MSLGLGSASSAPDGRGEGRREEEGGGRGEVWKGGKRGEGMMGGHSLHKRTGSAIFLTLSLVGCIRSTQRGI